MDMFDIFKKKYDPEKQVLIVQPQKDEEVVLEGLAFKSLTLKVVDFADANLIAALEDLGEIKTQQDSYIKYLEGRNRLLETNNEKYTSALANVSEKEKAQYQYYKNEKNDWQRKEKKLEAALAELREQDKVKTNELKENGARKNLERQVKNLNYKLENKRAEYENLYNAFKNLEAVSSKVLSAKEREELPGPDHWQSREIKETHNSMEAFNSHRQKLQTIDKRLLADVLQANLTLARLAISVGVEDEYENAGADYNSEHQLLCKELNKQFNQIQARIEERNAGSTNG
ncbi:MAG: hypothetical protein QM642_07790 [Edaphocola sp.]